VTTKGEKKPTGVGRKRERVVRNVNKTSNEGKFCPHLTRRLFPKETPSGGSHKICEVENPPKPGEGVIKEGDTFKGEP